MTQHNSGIGSKYTRARRPVRLLYYETYGTRKNAMRRERAIKKLSRRRKIQLVNTEKN